MLVFKSVMKKLYRPALFFFLLPIFDILLGSLFALRYDSFQFSAFIILYVFILINQMLENIFLRIPTSDFKLSKVFLFILEGLNILALFYFYWRYSWLAALVLLFYTLFIQFQFLFSYYSLDVLAVTLSNFFKIILLNGFSFYIHTSFIHERFIPYYLGLFIPFFLYEVARVTDSLANKWLFSLTGLYYVFTIWLLWSELSWQSLLALISLPVVGLLKAEFNRKTTAIFATISSLIYILLLLFAFFV